MAELTQQRDASQRRAEQLNEAFGAHQSSVAAEREAQAAHVRAVEDRAHAEIDRAREETKALQATLRRQEREASTSAIRLEKALDSARAAEHRAAEQGTRAKTLEQQLARMDGIPAALLAAQQALQAATQREAALHTKLESLKMKPRPSSTRKKPRDPLGAR